MLIGQLSKQSGFSRDTIRYYEKIGLITVPGKDRRENKYKEYSEGVLRRLLSIRKAKEFGFTLNEIAAMFALVENGLPVCEAVTPIAKDKVGSLEETIMRLTKFKDKIKIALENCACSGEPGKACAAVKD
jgi:DNA-binding transcriptional MerR regulator